MSDSNLETTKPSRSVEPSYELDLRDVLPVLPKILAGLLAGGVLLFNIWFSGIFSGGHPLDQDNWKFFLLVYLQAVFICFTIAVVPSLIYDVAGGVLAGTIFVIMGDLVGAFRHTFNLGSFLAQIFLAYTAAFLTVTETGRRKRRKASRQQEAQTNS